MANKCLAKPSRTLLQRLHEENQLWFSNSKHFRFYWKKKHFISELYFTKNHEIGSLVGRKVKKSGDSQQNLELGPAWESKSNCRSFHHIYHLDESKILKSSKTSVSKLAIALNWNIQSPHEDREMYKISTSRNGNNLQQLSFWYQALSCGANTSISEWHICILQCPR